jgi:prolyl-tRNA synthetase
MMQDKKALQAGTSHYLGQNFAKAFNIRFNNRDETLEYGYTTSWGVTTRLIGALIMTHSDDDGLCLPPRVAPYHAVIIPITNKPERAAEVLEYAKKIKETLAAHTCSGRAIATHIDNRELRGGEKNWEWIKKGVPLRIEVGPRDLDSRSIALSRRDQMGQKATLTLDNLGPQIANILDEMQVGYLTRAQELQKANTRTDITTFEELKAYFTPKNADKPEIHGGFVLAKWSGDPESEKLLDDLKVTIRCLPLKQSGTPGRCILTGKPATLDAIFAKSY